MVTVWWCLIHYSFLNHSETITSEKCAQQINEMQQILQHLQPILLNRRGPILLHDNIRTRHTTDASKVEQIGLQSLAFIHHNLLTTHSLTTLLQSSWQLFTRKMLLQPAGGKNAFQGFIKFQSTNFYTTEINQLYLIGKIVLIIKVLILINKAVFEPRDNDLNSLSETAITFAPT